MRIQVTKSKNWYFVLLPLIVVFSGCKQSAVSTQPDPIVDIPVTSCENQSGNTGPTYLTIYCVTEFDQAAVNLARNATEFIAQQFNWAFTGGPPFSSFSFRAVRAEFAHSVGLSGDGEIIAIVDNGFYVQHPELAGKQITVFGPVLQEKDHGTSVAAIAAGIQDGSGILGVAYDADLHLTSFDNSLSTIADATDDARTSGAIVQNNSWTFAESYINTILDRPELTSAEEAFANDIGVSIAAGTSYINALANFTNAGIVVFANSNDIDAPNLGLMEALPLAFPQLEAGWITALNGVPTFNEAGEITSAQRLSAECFEMARSCLMAEGVVIATSGANSYSGPQLGTSFAAPIISGGIAILAQAFPSLDGPEIRDRLFVTADNSFFVDADYSGTRVFTADISHDYSSEYGHGFMNLEAALLPIGTIGVPSGQSVSDGTTSIQQNSIATGFAQGDAIMSALRDVDVMVIDSLGGDFRIPAETFVTTKNSEYASDSFRLFAHSDQINSGVSGALKSLAYTLNSNSTTRFIGGDSFDVLFDIGLLPERSGLLFAPITMSETLADTSSFGLQTQLGSENNFAAYGFASIENPVSNSRGAGFVMQFGPKTNQLSIGTSIMEENGSALGMLGVSGAGMTSLSRALDVGYSARLDDNISMDFHAQIGTMTSNGHGMWGSQDHTNFSSYGIALNAKNVFSSDDRLIASVQQPIAIDGGTMTVAIPQSRDINGNVSTNFFDINLAPDERQLDLGLAYEVSLDQHATIKLGAAYNLNSGNVTDANTVGFAINYSLAF